MEQKVKIGRLLLLSRGEYSSYQRIGWFVVVQEFSPGEMLQKYKTEHPEKAQRYHFEENEFLAWILKQGVMAEVDEFFDEWFLGDYLDIDRVEFLPRAANSTNDNGTTAHEK